MNQQLTVIERIQQNVEDMGGEYFLSQWTQRTRDTRTGHLVVLSCGVSTVRDRRTGTEYSCLCAAHGDQVLFQATRKHVDRVKYISQLNAEYCMHSPEIADDPDIYYGKHLH